MHVTWRHERLGSREVIARRLFVALCCLALAPAALAAQRSGMGGFGRGRIPGSLAREPGIVIPKQVNMINLLIQNRPEVALTDSQFVRVIAMKRALDSTNAPLMRKLDSVSRVFRGGAPLFSEPSRSRADSLAEARAVVRETTAALHEHLTEARDRAYALLDEQQLVRAQAMEAKPGKAVGE